MEKIHLGSLDTLPTGFHYTSGGCGAPCPETGGLRSRGTSPLIHLCRGSGAAAARLGPGAAAPWGSGDKCTSSPPHHTHTGLLPDPRQSEEETAAEPQRKAK